MDVNVYFAEKMIEQRLAEDRTLAARSALLASLRPRRRPARVVLGRALVRLGRWLLSGVPVEAPSEAQGR